MKVSVNELKSGMVLDEDVRSGDHVLARKGTVITNDLIEKFKFWKVGFVEVASRKEEEIVLREEEKKLEDYYTSMKRSAEDLVVKIKEKVLSNSRVETGELRETVDRIVFSTFVDPDVAARVLNKKTQRDDYLISHMGNVCGLSLLLGVHRGYSDKELFKLGMGAILHDVGMFLLPEEIYSKEGKLSDEEMKEVRKHPRLGAELVANSGVDDEDVLDIVLHHHERLDGSGYPDGLEGDELSEFVKIVSFVDVFEALTSPRAYRSGKMPHEAYTILMPQAGRGFDKEVVKFFLKGFSFYPIGSEVELNTGERGVVVKHTDNIFRPVIDVYYDENGEKLDPPLRLDLSKKEYFNRFIKSSRWIWST